MTIIADYCAHVHRDDNDYLLGTNAIMSLEKPFKKGGKNHELQLHFLPEYSRKEGMPPLAFNLGNGSICFENAGAEKHATTPLTKPCKTDPNRIGLISYLHKFTNRPNHGEEFSGQNKDQINQKLQQVQNRLKKSIQKVKKSPYFLD